MKNNRLANAAALLAAVLMSSVAGSGAQDAKPDQAKPLPRVLLIGDSICGGYQKDVKKLLEGKAVVVKNEGNAEYTGTGLKKIDAWLGDGKWDVIHFNWGLWDMYGWQYAKEDRSPPVYERRLEALVTRLEKTGAELIWATTTPACPGLEGTMLKRFKTELRITPAVERQYLDAALRVMKKHNVRVNDLHALMLPDLEKYSPAPDNVHFTGAGCGVLARQVADSILAALAGSGTSAAPDKEPPATAKSVRELQEDFLKLKFGMFLHYNMATYTGDEWVKGYPDPSTFDPGGKVDTDAWADAAVSAGMKYGVLTVKHVGGFCLWDSKHTTYDVMHPNCPYKQDLVAQFIESFKSRGLKAGLYYCWRHPGFGDPDKHKVLPPECDPATHSLEEQNKFQLAQIGELVEKYPDVFYIWNDALDDKVMPAEEVLTRLRSIRPDVLASSNWWSWGRKGTPYTDIAVKELRHFPETNKAPGETCWKLEQKWFWKEGSRAGSAKGVMGNMATAHSRNSNFLLNAGPDRKGKIVESSLKTLAEIGKLRNPKTAP